MLPRCEFTVSHVWQKCQQNICVNPCFHYESGVPVVLSLIGHVHTTDRKSRFMKEHTNEC